MRFRRSLLAAALTALVAVGVGLSRAQTAAPEEAEVASTVLPCSVGTDEGRLPSYLADSFPQLKEAVPALHGLKIEEDSSVEDSEKILNATSAAIAAMLPRVPNLIAKEEVSQAALPIPYMVDAGTQSNANYPLGRGRSGPLTAPSPASRAADDHEVNRAIQTILNAPKNRIEFSYRVQSNPDATSGMKLREFRMNAQNETILTASTAPGNPRGVGFGSAWLMFEPENLNQFRFRYLGREKIGKRDTVVMAFAQIPERATTPARISIGGATCYYFVQGVIWIDPVIFQMVRLQTDLLAPLTGMHQRKLRSEIDFSEIRIPARNLTLWMPSRVEINWEMDTVAGAELHTYSDYRLFGSTIRILIPDQN